jgi:hypothetical protein
LWIGQGATDGSGIQVLDMLNPTQTLRQLELGDCRFLRANRVGETVTLAFTRPEGVVLIRTTMAELRALPPVEAPEPPHPPEPPDPAPEPGPEPPEPVPVPPEPPHGFHVPLTYSTGGVMQSEKGGIIGAGGKYGRMGPMGSSPVGGWRQIIFDGNDSTGDYEFTLTETAPGRGVAQDTKTGSYAGQDIAVGSLSDCAYGKPDNPGGYETPYLFGPVANGVKFLWVSQNPNIGVPFGCSILTWVPRA